ncbi:MAG: TatD family hydrolase [Saccharofermentanales bacterium]
MTFWFDTHSHIQDPIFQEDFQEVLERAKNQGVTRILLAASGEEDARQACQLALEHPMLYVALGVHPHEASSWDPETGDRLKTLTEEVNRQARESGRDPIVVAIGEIGLDFYYDFSPREIQHQVFRTQLELAHELDLPLVIHMREATAATLEALNLAHQDGLLSEDHPPGVIHCYSGSAETLPALLKLGFMIGFDGPITFKNAKKPLEALAAVPHDRLVLETDAPWLTPTPYRGKRNEPSYLPIIGQKAAEILGLSPEETAALTTDNAKRLFRID